MPVRFRPASARSSWIFWFTAIIILITLLPMGIVLFQMWGARTMRYELTASDLVITYGSRHETIHRREITSLSVIHPTHGVRTFGTGRPGLQTGSWRFTETGPIELTSSSTETLVVIETPTGKRGISPSDPEGFKNAFDSGKTGNWDPVAVSGLSRFAELVVFGLIGPAIGGGLGFWLWWTRKRMAYELDKDALLIHGAFKPIHVPYDEIERIEIANPRGIPWRTIGTSMPGLYWGRFSWRQAGPNLRLYAVRYKPLVLVHARGATYGITPDEAETFVQAISQRLTR